jgi:phage gpG-like protein
LAVKSNIAGTISMLQRKTAELAPNSPQLKEAFIRIGLYVSALAKMEARRKGIVDRGRLINSIRYEFFTKGSQVGVLVGSFNVKYAALNEFGGVFTEQMRRAMFYSMRKRGGSRRGSKGVIQGNRFRARPYLRPAFTKSRTFVLDTLRAAVTFAKQGV